ncbi:hypothetical protein TVAG_075030 [Trichomonas vaginalis G3]|uniref:BACK domain-containing protein n=1 Tax=Trichomonas vaginalis (strain ATCC PRA-98 / G3) TaxID=412133 RepID=A2GIT1_TRIV3|nr:nerve growth factor signaling pathway [Trichomonas vaginalis G3]EAX82935.1 hypothetical protein TVAG_075030 [Trichomonas vaginalis G3]KAI5495358.1 nerve growth factor signaling pathway [Trichomonas vaginalis G3]|eukprot:XP_001295865.1 hypothetical protein [Trichomonas vaginalis G3]
MDNMKIDKNNCIQLLEFYFDICSNDKVVECSKFIASHFFEIDSNQLKNISKKLGIDILQQIFSSDELTLEDEDSLANFIVSLTQENNDFYQLIENIHFEFCNENIIKKIKDLANSNNYQNIVNSLSDSLVRSRNHSTKDRTIYPSIKTKYFESGNVEMPASSINHGSIDIINKHIDDLFFETQNFPNSWVQWKLKQNYSIEPTEYFVRTFSNCGKYSSSRLRSWKVEGTTISGETKIIHEVDNSPLSNGEIRIYPLKINDKFISFKLIQIGTSLLLKFCITIHADKFNLNSNLTMRLSDSKVKK